MIVGTTENQVAPDAPALPQNLPAENRSHMASDPPEMSAPITVTHNPLM